MTEGRQGLVVQSIAFCRVACGKQLFELRPFPGTLQYSVLYFLQAMMEVPISANFIGPSMIMRLSAAVPDD